MNAPMKEHLAMEGRARRLAALLRSSDDDSIDLGELLRKLWRRKSLVLGTVILLTLLAIIVVVQLTPRYSAEAFVMIDPREDRVVDIEAVVSGLSNDTQTIESEIEVIRSRGLAAKVIEKLSLDQNPEINASLRPPPAWQSWLLAEASGAYDSAAAGSVERSWRAVVADWLANFMTRSERSFGAASGPKSGEVMAARRRARMVDAFLERLKVRPEGRSRVISLQFQSEDPEVAANVVNTTAELYIVEQLEAKYEATQRATEWLNNRLSELRQKVQESEKDVEEFRAKAGLTEGKGVTITSQRIAELNSQLIQVTAKRAEAESRVAQVERVLGGAKKYETVSEVLGSPLIQNLRVQEAEIEQRVAELSAELGPRHPRMIQLNAEAENIRSKITREIEKITQALRNEVRIATARETTVKRQMHALEREAGELGSAQVQLQALQREANANRLLMETFLTRFKETSNQNDIQQADARIISRADVPEYPTYPKKKLIVLLVFFGSGMLGVLLAFAAEHLDHGFRSMEQVEQLAGVPALGLVPALTGMKNIGQRPENVVLQRPSSAYGEAIRTLRTGLMLSDVDRSPKVIMFTSALPGEGKTSLSLSLARQSAAAGERVIYVDTDLRQPRGHRSLGMPVEPGLVELLAGEVGLDEGIRTDSASGLDVIVAGQPMPNPPDLLNSMHMRALIEELAGRYDLVILDSPPLTAVADARILARLADKTVFAVRWASTRREVVTTALRQLIQADADLVGVVLSMVNVKRHARYGYGDSGYYYGRASKYYTG